MLRVFCACRLTTRSEIIARRYAETDVGMGGGGSKTEACKLLVVPYSHFSSKPFVCSLEIFFSVGVEICRR